MGNQPSSVPFGSSINLVNTTLQCTQRYGSGSSNTTTSVSLPLAISVTAPLYVGFTQQFYYGDLKVAVGVPYQLAYDQREYGTYYQVNVSTTLDIPRTYASDIRGLPLTVSAGMLRNWTQYEANIPADPSKVLPPQGPVSTVYYEYPVDFDLRVKSVTMVFQNLLGNLQPIDSPRVITCENLGTRDFILATTTGYTQAVPDNLLAPANGYQAAFPRTLDARKTSIINLPVGCAFDTQTRYPFNLTIGGQGPASVAANTDIALTNFNTFLTVPPSVISQLSSDNPRQQGRKYRLQFDVGRSQDDQDLKPGIGLNFTAAAPPYLDLSRDFTDSKDSLPLSTARNVEYSFGGQETFALPLVASLSTTLTAAASGSFGVSMNVFQGVLQQSDTDWNYLAKWTTVCKSSLYQYAFLKSPIYKT